MLRWGAVKFRIQPHVRLQEWVADELGYFREAGLDYTFDTGLAGAAYTASTVAPAEAALGNVLSGALEDMEKGRSCEVSAACHWAVNAVSSAAHGRMWGKAYSISPSAIFVTPESSYQRPEDLARVPVGVGHRSGSHYSALQGLEPFLRPEQIELSYVGLPYDRVKLMLERRIEAANVFGAQYYVLEQLGFRKLVDTTFMIGFLVAEDADIQDLEKYFAGLRLAQREIDLRPEQHKHHWLREMPEDISSMVDVRRFGPGERIVFEPYTREMYEQTHTWMRTHALFDPATAARPSYEEAVLH
jgi:NitT/TauT family transport system substrate-binding protein